MQHQRAMDSVSESASKYGKLVKSAVDYSNTHYDDIAKNFSGADRTVRAFVAERPFVAVGMALAMGYLVARTINGIR